MKNNRLKSITVFIPHIWGVITPHMWGRIIVSCMKKIITIFLFFTFVAPLYATENLLATDYIGTWVTHGKTPVKDEKQSLIINKDNSSYFERNFDGNKQMFNSPSSLFLKQEDLLIIKYNNKDNELRYKLVLSGWRSGETYALYGFMYMYSEGKQFNGLPVSFRRQ